MDTRETTRITKYETIHKHQLDDKIHCPFCDHHIQTNKFEVDSEIGPFHEKFKYL